MDKDNAFIFVVLLLTGVVAAISLTYYMGQSEDCERRHGVLVRGGGFSPYACVAGPR